MTDPLKALEAAEEVVEFRGQKFLVRELEAAADSEGLREEDSGYTILTLCVFREDGTAAFSKEQIPKLKKSSRAGVNKLMAAIARVNGYDVEQTAKNSEAAPGGG